MRSAARARRPSKTAFFAAARAWRAADVAALACELPELVSARDDKGRTALHHAVRKRLPRATLRRLGMA